MAVLGHAGASLGQDCSQLAQIDAGLCLVERQDQVGLRLEPMRALISVKKLGGDVPLKG